MTAQGRFVVRRVHNNNIVLAVDAEGRSVVLQGNGVGFGARRGTLVDPTRIDAVFEPREGASPEAAAGMLADIPPEVVACARRIVEDAGTTLPLERPGVLLLPIADHLHQAVRRAERRLTMEFPLVWEVRNLYPAELAAGRRGLDIVQRELGIRLPEGEATAFALHFVSAHFSGAVIDRTMRMTQILAQVFDLIDAHRGSPLDRDGEAAARFVSHLHFLFVRLAEDRAVAHAPVEVREALQRSLPGVMAIALDITDLLAREWESDVTGDETTYIGLHVHRLLAEAVPPASDPNP